MHPSITHEFYSVSWKIPFDSCIFYYDGPTNMYTFLSIFLYIRFL